MATPAQITANRINAQLSTGPKTPEGKAAVADNRTTHGFTGNFRVLAFEDPAAFAELLDSYVAEFRPITATQRFLVDELAQAQWRIMRGAAVEAELLNPGENPDRNPGVASLAQFFRDTDALVRLERYLQAARRAYYKAQSQLTASRLDNARFRQAEGRRFEQEMIACIEAPVPTRRTIAAPAPPMPAHLLSELDTHRRRDPDFDPSFDASQLSAELRKWYERHPSARNR